MNEQLEGVRQGESCQPALSAPTRPAMQLRAATFADYCSVAELQQRNGLASKPYADWCALWKENPAYNSQAPIGWVLETHQQSVVGFLGNLPLAYTFQGRTLASATGHSWVVDSEYRGYSIALLNTFLKQQSVDLFVFATVNAAAESVLRVFGLKKVPVGQWDLARMWITGYRGFANSVMTAHSVPLAGIASPVLASALWTKDRLWSMFSRLRPAPNELSVQLEVQRGFDARFQHFWEESKQQQHGRLLAVRDRETLDWHYRSTIRQGSLWVVSASIHGVLVAYWTLDRQDHSELGLKRLRFVDFQALPGYEGLLRTAIAWMLNKCREDGVHVAEDLGSWLERLQVRGAEAPYKRRMKSWLFYYLARGALGQQLLNPAVWTPSSFDGDASV